LTIHVFKEVRSVKKTALLIAVMVMVFSVSLSPAFAAEGGKKIGFAETDIASAWRLTQVESMTEEAKARGYEIIITDANHDSAKQISDVEDLLAQRVDYLFLAALDMDAIRPALDAAKAAKVPVFCIDRKVTGTWKEDYAVTIIADYVRQGEMCGNWVLENTDMSKKIKIVEVTGTVGGSDVRDRHTGFMNIVNAHDNLEVVASQSGEWTRAEAQSVLENIIQSTGGEFDVVYTHSDEMALGCVYALKSAGIKGVKVIGIDGQKEAVQAIIDGDIAAIATCNPRFGPAAFKALDDYINGKELTEFIINEEYLITAANAEEALKTAF
jgi:ABC-type sugar transport system substrate-binding protein